MSQHASVELARIDDELHRAYEGDPWHGPALRKVLEGVTAEVARARPVPDGHSIWELVAHLSAWDDVVTRRIAEGRAIEEPDGGNFPPVVGDGPESWADALLELDRQHARLREALRDLDPSRLGEAVAGKGYTIGYMLHGVAQHMAYHAGQIALLRKLEH